MLCPKCQKENLGGVKFCAFCGASINVSDVQSNTDIKWNKFLRVSLVVKIIALVLCPFCAFMVIIGAPGNPSFLENVFWMVLAVCIFLYPIVLLISFFKRAKKWKIFPLIHVAMVIEYIITLFIYDNFSENEFIANMLLILFISTFIGGYILVGRKFKNT